MQPDFHSGLQRNVVQVVRERAARQRSGSAERERDDRPDFGGHRRLTRLFPELQVSFILLTNSYIPFSNSQFFLFYFSLFLSI